MSSIDYITKVKLILEWKSFIADLIYFYFAAPVNMQNPFRCYVIVLLLCILSGISYSQDQPAKRDSADKDTTVNINIRLSDFVSEDPEDKAKADSVLTILTNDDNLVKFTNPWKVKKGDNKLYAVENYNDSNWVEVENDSLKKEHDKQGSIRWYRMHFEIDSTLMNVPLAVIDAELVEYLKALLGQYVGNKAIEKASAVNTLVEIVEA